MSERYKVRHILYGLGYADVFIDTETGDELDSEEVLDLLNSTVWTPCTEAMPDDGEDVRVRRVEEFDAAIEFDWELRRKVWDTSVGTRYVEFTDEWQPIRGPKP